MNFTANEKKVIWLTSDGRKYIPDEEEASAASDAVAAMAEALISICIASRRSTKVGPRGSPEAKEGERSSMEATFKTSFSSMGMTSAVGKQGWNSPCISHTNKFTFKQS